MEDAAGSKVSEARFAFYLPYELWRATNAAAHADGRSMGSWVRQAIRAALAKAKATEDQR